MWKCDIEWQNKHTVSLSMNYTERLHVIAPCLSADYKQEFLCSSCVPKIDSVYYRYKLRFPYLEWHIMLLPSRQTKRKLFLGSWSFCVPICVDSSIVSAQPWYQKWLQSILVHTCAYSPEWKLSVLVSDLYGRGRVPTIFITLILSYTGKRHIFNVKYGYYGYIKFLLHANVACACKSKNFCRKKS